MFPYFLCLTAAQVAVGMTGAILGLLGVRIGVEASIQAWAFCTALGYMLALGYFQMLAAIEAMKLSGVLKVIARNIMLVKSNWREFIAVVGLPSASALILTRMVESALGSSSMASEVPVLYYLVSLVSEPLDAALRVVLYARARRQLEGYKLSQLQADLTARFGATRLATSS